VIRPSPTPPEFAGYLQATTGSGAIRSGTPPPSDFAAFAAGFAANAGLLGVAPDPAELLFCSFGDFVKGDRRKWRLSETPERPTFPL
jgi:hypothetical protein